MPPMLSAALVLGLAIAAPGAQVNHTARVDHHSGPVTAHYRGQVDIQHKQVGTVAPGGRASTLRCDWSARLTVARQATATSGRTMHRSFVSQPAVAGSRIGWCSTHREAIAKDVAARLPDLDRHLQTVASEDHDVLRAELDHAHGLVATG